MMASEAEKYHRDYSQEFLKRRLEIVLHFKSIPFNFDMNNLPKMEKLFSQPVNHYGKYLQLRLRK